MPLITIDLGNAATSALVAYVLIILLPFASAVALAAVPVVSWFQVGILAVILPAALVNVNLAAVKLAAVISLLERSVLVAYVEVIVLPLPSLVALVALDALPVTLPVKGPTKPVAVTVPFTSSLLVGFVLPIPILADSLLIEITFVSFDLLESLAS